MAVHALRLPSSTRDVRTWCGVRIDSLGDDTGITSAPSVLTCERCAREMEEAHYMLSYWIEGLTKGLLREVDE